MGTSMIQPLCAEPELKYVVKNLSIFFKKSFPNGIKHRQMLKGFIALYLARIDESQQSDAFNELF